MSSNLEQISVSFDRASLSCITEEDHEVLPGLESIFNLVSVGLHNAHFCELFLWLFASCFLKLNLRAMLHEKPCLNGGETILRV